VLAVRFGAHAPPSTPAAPGDESDQCWHDRSVDYTTQLRELARKCGISTEYRGWDQSENEVSDTTLQRILRARGIAADTEAEVASSTADLENAPWRRMLPPVVVTVAGDGAQVSVHVAHGDPVAVHLTHESGESLPLAQLQIWIDPREVDGILVGRATFDIPGDIPVGWHTITATSAPGEGTRIDIRLPLAEKKRAHAA